MSQLSPRHSNSVFANNTTQKMHANTAKYLTWEEAVKRLVGRSVGQVRTLLPRYPPGPGAYGTNSQQRRKAGLRCVLHGICLPGLPGHNGRTYLKRFTCLVNFTPGTPSPPTSLRPLKYVAVQRCQSCIPYPMKQTRTVHYTKERKLSDGLYGVWC